MKNLVSVLVAASFLLAGCLSNPNQPAPTASPTVQTTYTPLPTYTPYPTGTPMPTATPEPTPTETATPMPTATQTVTTTVQLLANPPFATISQTNENGVEVTTLEGFDLNEFGGNDSQCGRTELEAIHIGEVVSSQDETCLIVIEWSLKVGADTIVAGVYAVSPGEWFYIPLAVAGLNDSPRIVGTLWYLPKEWNSHMYAADVAGARDERDGTTSFVGLSPTDPWVQAIADALLRQ